MEEDEEEVEELQQRELAPPLNPKRTELQKFLRDLGKGRSSLNKRPKGHRHEHFGRRPPKAPMKIWGMTSLLSREDTRKKRNRSGWKLRKR